MARASSEKTSAMKLPPAKDVDEYLASVPKEARASLEKLRKTIKAAAPEAQEVISYRMPIFKYHGMLVGFASFKNHNSFFVMSTTLLDNFQQEVRNYSTARGTIHFPFDKPLPATLVRKIVKSRIAMNEAKQQARERKRASKKK